ncbi:hypothetical protein AALO_G00076200 [Alosa alosa]|uniref:Uncharacterized protein n=1 Tax=Alosa alosa TaxID=278164 RepID=A0AAV6GXZ7_9TELE|nr:hypothetical protein AALO_G00076200 [Alosa alosa]
MRRRLTKMKWKTAVSQPTSDNTLPCLPQTLRCKRFFRDIERPGGLLDGMVCWQGQCRLYFETPLGTRMYDTFKEAMNAALK